MTNLFIDTNTSFQPHDTNYYKKMYQLGARSNFIKVSESTNWVANNWIDSLNNSQKAGLIPCVYHFLRATNNGQASAEADFFRRQLDNAKVAKSIKIMVDAESTGNNTNNILAFINQVKKSGYTQFSVYSGRFMWITSVLDQTRLPRPWVASYNPSLNLGINNAQAYQYSDKFKGYSQDISKDLSKDQWFTTDKTPRKPQKHIKHTAKPAKGVSIPQGIKDVAQDVIRGVYGNGSQRSSNIYKHVQNAINLKSSGKWKGQEKHSIALIADDVLFNKKYGNGSIREKNIYAQVQKEVNRLLK